MIIPPRNQWPKVFPPATPEQEAVADDWMKYWLGILPDKYGFVETFNHGYPLAHTPKDCLRTLDIGAGLGEHLRHEALTDEQKANYYALEIRENVAENLRRSHPQINTIVGSCEERLPFEDHYFDRIIAIHVLEHLRNLPAALGEILRLLNPTSGVFNVVIPCEGGLMYGLGRRLTSQRVFEKRYNRPYQELIQRDHVNTAREVRDQLGEYFFIQNRRYFPIYLPTIHFNLCIGLTATAKRSSSRSSSDA